MRTTARKFVAATSREALRLVREALGAEAIVLNHRAIPEGVEIVAMVEGEMTQAVASAAPVAARRAPLPAAPVAPVMPAMAMPVAAPAVVPVPAAAWSTLPPLRPHRPEPTCHERIHSMRGMLEEQLASVVWNERQRQDPVRGRLLRTLLGAGFSAKLSKAMLEKLPTGQSYAEGMAFARAELIRAVPVHEDEDALLAQGGVYALMGPTGVGKTTTTAKLAARCVMRFGADKLALVTTDSYRIGAYEQLRIYGQILDVPVFAVKDAADLHLVLQDLRDKHMVLIDTVGMSQRDRSVSDQIAMLCNSHRPVKRLLLLNATSHGDTLNEVVHAYRHGGGGNELAGCIFTKVDEATHPGALIDTVIRHRLPVHYISSGQKVPENLMLADRAQLVDSVFQPRRHNPLFVPAEVDMQDEAAGAAPSAQVVQAQAETDRLRLQLPEPDPRHGARRPGTGDRGRRAGRRADRLRGRAPAVAPGGRRGGRPEGRAGGPDGAGAQRGRGRLRAPTCWRSRARSACAPPRAATPTNARAACCCRTAAACRWRRPTSGCRRRRWPAARRPGASRGSARSSGCASSRSAARWCICCPGCRCPSRCASGRPRASAGWRACPARRRCSTP